MSSNRWVAAQKYRAQVVSMSVTGYDASTTYSITIGRKVYSVIAQGSAAATATALYNAVSGSTDPEFTEITWTNPSSATIGATAVTPGYPFTATISVSGGTGTISQSTTTANQSPNDINDAANWSANAVPVNGDDLFWDNSNVGVFWNLSSLSAVTPNSISIEQSYGGTDPSGQPCGIGLPEQNTIGQQYEEYRPQWCVFAGVTTNITIGKGTGSGSGRLKFDFGSTAFAAIILNTGASGLDLPTLEAVLLKGTGANTVIVDGGSVAIAPFGTDAATLTGANALRVAVGGNGTTGAESPSVRCGPGVTFSTATVTQGGGTIQLYTAPTTILNRGGTLILQLSASATVTTLTIGGTFQGLGALTVSTMTGLTGGTADWSLDPTAVTVTNGSVAAGFTWNDPLARVTMANPFTSANCDPLANVSWVVGAGRSVRVT